MSFIYCCCTDAVLWNIAVTNIFHMKKSAHKNKMKQHKRRNMFSVIFVFHKYLNIYTKKREDDYENEMLRTFLHIIEA